MKLIGACGAGGVGKTTTMSALAKELGTELIPSVSRGIFKSRGLTEIDQRLMTPEQRLDLQLSIYAAKEVQDEEILQTSGADTQIRVGDRTHLDHLVYCLYRCGEIMTEEMVNDLKARTIRGLRNYTTIFYFPLHTFEGQNDGFRENGFGYRAVCDIMYRALLTDLRIPHEYIAVAPVEERVEHIKKIMTYI
jgi:predicted ATPase